MARFVTNVWKSLRTENAWILRVPLREFNQHDSEWISRFEFWPETYAIDAQKNYWQNFKVSRT